VIDQKYEKDEIIFNIECLYQNLYNNIQKDFNHIKFTDIDEIEAYIHKFIDKRYEHDKDFVSHALSNIDESKIIKSVRKFYASFGIYFRTIRKVPITIITEDLPITFSRYLLAPKTPEDAKLLFAREGIRNIYPLDIALNISKLPHKLTVNAMLKVSKIAIQSSSYSEASKNLAEYHRIKLNPATIMSVTDHIGDLSFKDEMKRANERFRVFDDKTIDYSFPEIKKDGILYIEMDGAFLNTRDKTEKAKSSWHESKLGLVFSSLSKRVVQKRNTNTKSDSDDIIPKRERYELTSKEYTSYIGSVDIFKKLIFECAMRNGYGKYKNTVLISDGATWIRNLKEDIFCDAQQILDFFHLCEKISIFGKSFFKIPIIPDKHGNHIINDIDIKDNKNYDKYRIWTTETCLKLRLSRYNQVLDDIISKESSYKISNKNKLSKYIINNINNIDYALYEQKGYDIGSGAVESGNKSVLKKRLVGPGMRWYLASAQNIVSLTSKLESHRWYEDVVKPVKEHYKIKI
jgi:hypothetical protein